MLLHVTAVRTESETIVTCGAAPAAPAGSTVQARKAASVAKRRIDGIGRRFGRAAALAAFFGPRTGGRDGPIEWSGDAAHPDVPSIVTAVTAVELDAPRAAPRQAWRLTLGRFLSDRAAVASLVAFAFVLFASFAGGPIVSAIVGHNGFQQFPYATHADLDPVGVWSRVPTTAQVRLDVYGNLLPPPKGSPTTLDDPRQRRPART